MWFSVGELASAGSYRVFLVESFSSKAGWIVASMIVGEAGTMIAATDNNFEKYLGNIPGNTGCDRQLYISACCAM